MHQLCIDNILSRLDFKRSDGCFSKSTSLAQRHIEIRCCVVQAPSKERMRNDSQITHKGRPDASDAKQQCITPHNTFHVSQHP